MEGINNLKIEILIESITTTVNTKSKSKSKSRKQSKKKVSLSKDAKAKDRTIATITEEKSKKESGINTRKQSNANNNDINNIQTSQPGKKLGTEESSLNNLFSIKDTNLMNKLESYNNIIVIKNDTIKKSKEFSINSKFNIVVQDYKAGSINFTVELLSELIEYRKGLLHISKRAIYSNQIYVQKLVELKKASNSPRKSKSLINNFDTTSKNSANSLQLPNSLFVIFGITIDYSDCQNLLSFNLNKRREKSSNSKSPSKKMKSKSSKSRVFSFGENFLPIDDYSSISTVSDKEPEIEKPQAPKNDELYVSYIPLDDVIKYPTEEYNLQFQLETKVVTENLNTLLTSVLNKSVKVENLNLNTVFINLIYDLQRNYYSKFKSATKEALEIMTVIREYKKYYFSLLNKKQKLQDLKLKLEIKKTSLLFRKKLLQITGDSIDINKEDINFNKRLFKLEYSNEEVKTSTNLTDPEKRCVFDTLKRVISSSKFSFSNLTQTQKNFVADFVEKNKIKFNRKSVTNQAQPTEDGKGPTKNANQLAHIELKDEIELSDLDQKIDKVIDDYVKKKKITKPIIIKKTKSKQYEFNSNRLLIKKENNQGEAIKLSIGDEYLMADKFFDKYLVYEELRQQRRRSLRSNKRLSLLI